MRKALLALLVTAAIPACGDGGGNGSAVGGSASGVDPFSEAELTTYEISMSPAEWDAMRADLYDNRWRRCTIAWKGEVYEDVGIHPAGQSSREPQHARKPSFWLSFKEFVPGREFHGYERVKLDAMADDPAMVRERLAYPIYAARGVPAPKVMHCRVVVNGAYMGLYLLEERINKEFVTKRFGKDPVNQLYRWTEMHPDVDYDPSWPDAVFAQMPSGPGATVGSMWEARIESLPTDAAGVRELVRLINTDPAAAGTLFDVNLFIQMMAVEAATGETDGYIGNNHTNPDEFYTGNLFLYRNPRTGRYLLAVWDRDQSFWRGPRLPSDPPTYDDSITFGFDRRILTRNLILSDAAGLAAYRRALRETVEVHARPETLNARLDTILAQIQDAAFADTNRIFAPTNEALVQEWNDELRLRFQRRYDDVLRQLDAP